ncbi:hypothetical protein GUJ93_ZPchr0001g29636 [Zizania palustris]|uniref:Uncharacterized protein n=1 Tax=Zizania palustris TaxID=103762 RepID=A0A8J5VTJ1_ZIZPA|nr:hypothetical protein GUJ93_ZPchr0001g29636 [Zizania palustris]
MRSQISPFLPVASGHRSPSPLVLQSIRLRGRVIVLKQLRQVAAANQICFLLPPPRTLAVDAAVHAEPKRKSRTRVAATRLHDASSEIPDPKQGAFSDLFVDKNNPPPPLLKPQPHPHQVFPSSALRPPPPRRLRFSPPWRPSTSSAAS